MAGTVFLYFVAIIIPVVVVVLVLVLVMVVEHKFIGTLSTESHSQTVHENYFQCLAGTVFIFFHFTPFIIIPVVVVLILVVEHRLFTDTINKVSLLGRLLPSYFLLSICLVSTAVVDVVFVLIVVVMWSRLSTESVNTDYQLDVDVVVVVNVVVLWLLFKIINIVNEYSG